MFRGPSCRPGLLNQDVFSTITYSLGPVSYSQKFRQKLQSLACQTLKRRGHFQSTVPFECFSIPRTENGLGLHNIHVMYKSEKAKFLRNVIRTPDVLCRLTSLENIDSLHLEFRYMKNILDPSYSPISPLHAAWLKLYPLFYKEGHEALKTLDWSTHANDSCNGLHDVSVQEFIMPFLPAASSHRYILQLQDLGFTQMKGLCPSLFEVAGPLPTNGSLAVTAEIDTLQFRFLATSQRDTVDDEVFNLSTSIRHVPISGDFQVGVFSKAVRISLENYLWTNRWGDFKRPLSDRVCSFPKGVSFSRHVLDAICHMHINLREPARSVRERLQDAESARGSCESAARRCEKPARSECSCEKLLGFVSWFKSPRDLV
jgi:hypothetical protein